MKYKTSDLTGEFLDAAVAKAQGFDGDPAKLHDAYSSDWADGGPIIERERIALWAFPYDRGPSMCVGWHAAKDIYGVLGGYTKDVTGEPPPRKWFGTTPLIAAMRAYVANNLGEEVELP